MSLHYLGISHFPVLHRQFSSPTAASFQESSPGQELIQDSKDVLIDRLNDLAVRLSNDNFEDHTVSELHRRMDEMELFMRGEEKNLKSIRVENDGYLRPTTPSDNGEDAFWGSLSPTQSVRIRLPKSPKPRKLRPRHVDSNMTTFRVNEISKQAEELVSQLTTVVTELQLRKEESDHLHDLLLLKAEKASERILLLEYRIAEMEDDFGANQSELKFLRIQLQAIEAQCGEYLPLNKDEDLTQSITNWKIDWEDINQKSKARRKKCHMSTIPLEKPEIVINGS